MVYVMCKLANTDKISVFAHLSKLLVNDSKFEGVVHLVLIISHHQLGSLYINKNNYVLLTLPVTLSYSTCYTLPFLLWQLGKHVFLFSNMPPGSFIGPLLHKADMQQTVTALSEGSDLVIASCRPRHRWVFFSFPEAQAESMLHHTPPRGSQEENRQIHLIHFRKLFPSCIINRF